MDDILSLGDDLSGLLDIPNTFCDDEMFRDIDTLDFVNEFDNDLIFDYDTDKNLSTPDIYKLLSSDSLYFQQERNPNQIHVHGHSHVNTKSNETNSIKIESKENAEQKLMIIRELLDSNTCASSVEMIANIQTSNSRPTNGKSCIATSRPGVGSAKSVINPRNITSKHTVILPSTNISSSFLKSPTLAATLISIQPSKTGGPAETTQNLAANLGRGVRHDSHNAIEKRYRLSINDKIDELRHMLFLGDDSKMNKSNVLKKAIERIKCLEDENNSLKCENYNLRISKNLPIINNGNSIESLNRTGSSPLSINSDSGQSIENGSSSSSMHSSSVTSDCLFMQTKEDNRQKFNNSNRGIKRPLIYNSTTTTNDNPINTIKNEKLARLLLDPKDNYIEKPSSYSSDIQNNRSSNNKSYSSNVPGFLLCTMALFVISFQPFDVILRKYQFQSSVATSGRHLLQYTNSEEMNNNGYLFAIFITLVHWSVAFFLVWGSTNNRFILRKSFSSIFHKIQIFISRLIHKKPSRPLHNLIDLKNSLKDCCQDRDVFRSKLNGFIEEYGCSYKANPINMIVQFMVCIIMILISFFRYNSHSKHVLNDTAKIRIHLLTVVIDQSFIDPSSFSRLEIAWYKCLLYSLSWNCEVTSDTLFARFVLSLSISTGFIRKYLLNKVFKSVEGHNSMLDGFHSFVKNHHAQKLFIKTNPQKLRDRFFSHCLDQRINPEKQGLINCYFMVHAQETIEMSSQIILDGQSDDQVAESLKDIVNCCPTILNDDESTYFSLWCCLLLLLLKNGDSRYLDKVASKLINHYKYLAKESSIIKSSNESTNSTLILKLLISTLRLCGRKEDKMFHEINIQCISDLQECSNLPKVSVMLLKLSHDRIVQALRTHNATPSTCLSNIIYYTHNYSKQLNKQYPQISNVGPTMVSEFEELLQQLCELNPLRQMTSNIHEKYATGNAKNHGVKIEGNVCYRITDFLSCDGDSKLRSH